MKKENVNRVGETKMMNCGCKCVITEYINSHDITVRFSDGAIVEHTLYSCFTNGNIRNPNIPLNKSSSRIGETRIMNCGMKCTIIEYINANDITVQFSDGSICKHKTYRSFVDCCIRPSNFSSKKHIGETRIMNCGMKCTIVEYINSVNITVQFSDGSICKHRKYDEFIKGCIKASTHSKSWAKERIGETRMMNCGMECTIIKYVNSNNITVQFSDGSICERRKYDAFIKGGIQAPTILSVSECFAKERIGETRMMNCGMECTIIKYIKADDITVRFKDGGICEHRTYLSFVKGQIKSPKLSKEGRFGETKRMNCGMECTIIKYIKADDITVRFSDGVVVAHRRYFHFKNGTIRHPFSRAKKTA